MHLGVRLVGWVGLVCSVVAMLGIGSILIAHPRSERGYLDYIDTYGNYDGRPLAEVPPSSVLFAAGDRACRWLDRQPVALWRTGSSWSVSSLYGRYDHATSAEDRSLPKTVVPGAWAYLCPASLYVHRPHHVFSRPGD